VIVTRGLGKAQVLGCLVAAGLAIGTGSISQPNYLYWTYVPAESRILLVGDTMENRVLVLSEERTLVVVELSRSLTIPAESRIVVAGA
jgi:hypothetical protein